LGEGSELAPLRGLAHLALLLMSINSRDHLGKELVLEDLAGARGVSNKR